MGKPPRHRGNHHGNPNVKKNQNVAIAAPQGIALQHSLKGVTSSNSSTGSAPSSVMCVPASQLTRELSDLSGSYMNGNTAPRSSLNRSFGNSVCSEEPVQGFWRQAYLLSTPCPREPTTVASAAAPPSSSALIVVERNGVIELVKKSDNGSTSDEEKKEKTSSQHDKESSNASSEFAPEDDLDLMFLSHNSPASQLLPAHSQNANDNDTSSRLPILILLMDPGRKQYELLQMWVDPGTDLVRDVLLALQRKLSDKWRQDYDGLFQLRGSNYCQLVHILSIAKYDLRPRELWVAKPWSMAAKSTIELANDCIGQLKASGLLSTYSASSPGKSRIKNFLRGGRDSSVPEEDGPLTLSDEAVKRMWFRNGVMKHHHAAQFLSFRAPAIPSRVLGQPHRSHNVHSGGSNRGFLGSLLGTSQSFDDVSSQLSNPSEAMLQPVSPGESPSKLHSSSSTASPSSSRRQRQGYSRQQKLPKPVNLDSRWHPSGPLEVVGEVIMNSSNKDPNAQADESEEGANVSTILADLETSHNISELNQTHDFDPPEVDTKTLEPLPPEPRKEQRCSLWTLLSPLNCAKRRSVRGGSRKGDDGYSSCQSSSAKNSNNQSSSNNNNDGRETPTSKGSGDGDDANDSDPFAWHGAGEDGSVVSDSAPLLSSMLGTSSSCGNSVPPEQPLHQLQVQVSPANQPNTVVSASPFSRFYK